MIKTRIGSLAISLALVVSIPAAVAVAQDAEECMASDPPLAVTFIPKQVNNPYFDAAATGAQKAAAELCGEFEQVGPSEGKADLQVPFIQDATTNQVSAIAISAIFSVSASSGRLIRRPSAQSLVCITLP